MRRWLISAVLLTVVLLLAGCGMSQIGKDASKMPDSSEDPLNIIVATDLHYISAALTDNGIAFQEVVETGDGKDMMDIETITEDFFEAVRKEKPDALILSGDLTFNGEKRSHQDLVKKLKSLEAEGIAVLAEPGNHDLGEYMGFAYSGASYAVVDNITVREFRRLYKKIGPAQAAVRDQASFSYVTPLRKDLWVLMLDANAGSTNVVTEETLKWTAKVMKQAEKAGAQVITVTHQNLLRHNPVVWQGYQLDNAEEVMDVLRTGPVICNLSGHIHLQHIMTGEIPEIVTSALSVSPLQYGRVSYDGTSLHYETVKLSTSASESARTFFLDTTVDQLREELEETEIHRQDIYQLAETYAALNLAYVSGDPIPTEENQAGIDLWLQQADSKYRQYVESILQDGANGQGHHECTIDVKQSK